MRYSFEGKGEGYAFAQKYNVDASYKDLSEVCRSIRRLPVEKAVQLLGMAERMEIPIEYRRHNKKLGHRRELGGKKGRYPIKAARLVKIVLLNALNNARVRQIDESTLTVKHAAANKQAIYPRMSPKGKRMRWNYETARIEIVLKGEPRQLAEISLPEKGAEKQEKPKRTGASKAKAGALAPNVDGAAPEAVAVSQAESPAPEVKGAKPEKAEVQGEKDTGKALKAEGGGGVKEVKSGGEIAKRKGPKPSKMKKNERV